MQYALIIRRNDDVYLLTFKAKNIHVADEIAIKETVQWLGEKITYDLYELGSWAWTPGTHLHAQDIHSCKEIALKQYEGLGLGSKKPTK